jgi:hypothetical protein
MKKLLLISFLMVLACAQTQTQVITPIVPVEVRDNLIPLPPYAIYIDRQFEFLGVMGSMVEKEFRDSTRKYTQFTERHVFADTVNGKNSIRRLVVLYVHRPDNSTSYYVADYDYSDFKGAYVDRGRTVVGSVDCPFLLKKNTGLAKDLVEFVIAKGYQFVPDVNTNPGHNVGYSKTTGGRSFQILYIESGATDKEVMENSKKIIHIKRN